MARTAGEVAMLAPDEPRLLYLQALAGRRLGNDKEAASLERKALKLNPNDPTARQNLDILEGRYPVRP